MTRGLDAIILFLFVASLPSLGWADLPQALYEEGEVVHLIFDARKSGSNDQASVSTFTMGYKFWKFGDEYLTFTETPGGAKELIHRRGMRIVETLVKRGDSSQPLYFRSLGFNQGAVPDMGCLYGVAELLQDLALSRTGAASAKTVEETGGIRTESISYTERSTSESKVSYLGDRIASLEHYGSIGGVPIQILEVVYSQDSDGTFGLPNSTDVLVFLFAMNSDAQGKPLSNFDGRVVTHQVTTTITHRAVPVESSISEVRRLYGSGMESIGRLGVHQAIFSEMAGVLRPTMTKASYESFSEIPKRLSAATNPPAKVGVQLPRQSLFPMLAVVSGFLLLVGAGVWFMRRSA
ncbi:hypothetical protein GC173_12870 [bacterium]|nr:hypothetical protein [bacterium]